MKIKEIVSEDVSAEDQLSGGEDSLNSNLLPVLMFLRKRSQDKELSAKLRTDSLIQLVQNAGDTTFDYPALVRAYEDSETVKELIKSFNKDTIELKSDEDIDSEEDDNDEHTSPEQNPEETVKSMSKRAAKNRQ